MFLKWFCSALVIVSTTIFLLWQILSSSNRTVTNLSFSRFDYALFENSSCIIPVDLIESTFVTNFRQTEILCSKDQRCNQLVTADYNQLLLRPNGNLTIHSDLVCHYRFFDFNEDRSDVSYSDGAQWDLKTNLSLKQNFMEFVCYNGSKVICESVYFGFTNEQSIKQKHLEADFNVVLLVLDGMSQFTFRLVLRETAKLLERWPNSYQFKLHHKVGLNTYPNLGPITSGIPFNKESNFILNMNDFNASNNFIWQLFAQNGYKTYMSIEERPLWYLNSAMSRYINKHNFGYNWWPFYKHISNQKWQNEHTCIAESPRIVKQLDHLCQFTNLFKEERQFIYFHICELIHNAPLIEGNLLDKPLVDHLVNWKLSGFLDRTVLFVLGDHGTRYTPQRYKDSKAQKLQENLPLLNIVIPESFRLSHPQLVSNLEDNQHKITSQFDVHATLIDLLRISRGKSVGNRKLGDSLFGLLKERNCADANIPYQYCSCQ